MEGNGQVSFEALFTVAMTVKLPGPTYTVLPDLIF